jgi:cysteine desulfurase
MTRPRFYCDYNAGAPVRPEAAAAVVHALEVGGNPSSIHASGRAARALMESARERIGAAIDARAENIVFTSGATEALHLALEAARGSAKSLVMSGIEHDALFAHGPRVFADTRIAPVTADGVIDLGALERILSEAPKPALIAVMLANNETGAVQPIAKIAALAREAGALLLVDAAQGIGRLPVSLVDLDASYLVISSHKLSGPPGTGALVLAPGAPFANTRFGGGQERGRRPGTENVPAISGFGAAVETAVASQAAEATRLAALRDRFERALPSDAFVFAVNAPRVPNTSLFALPSRRAEMALIALDLEGVAVSSGAACSSGKVRMSRVLEAMSAPHAESALRASFGWASTEADVDALIAAVNKIAAKPLVGAA